MNRNTLSTASAVGGVAALAACACGAGSGMVKALSSAGIHTTDTVIFGASCGTDHSVQPLFVGLGALLILIGMSLRKLSAAILAAIGCAAFAFGSLTAGPSTMSISVLPHPSSQMWGYLAYIVAAIFLIAAFLRAFPTPKPLAAGTAMAGMAVATGCSCCMVTGALSALIASGGMPWIYNESYLTFVGVGIVAVGLWKLGGLKPALFALVGGAITYGGGKLLNWALPELMIRGVNYRFVPGYLINLLGALTMLAGFVLAYRVANRQFAVEPTAPVLAEAVPAVGQ